MTFDDFITKWTGQPVDFDGVYPNQCMDLMHQYVYDVLGLTDASMLAHPAAYQVFTEFTETQYFDKIDNTPTGIPQKGDIILFNKTASNPYGHVCVFISGDANKFKSFDANWPTGSLPHVQDHTYGYCLGWLHPKNVQPDLQAQLDQMRQDRDKNWNMFVALCDALGVTHTVDVALAEVNKLVGLEDVLRGKEQQIEDASKQIQDLEAQIKQLTDSNATLKTTNDALNQTGQRQHDDITHQGDKRNHLIKQIADLKQNINLPTLTGWKLKLIQILSKF